MFRYFLAPLTLVVASAAYSADYTYSCKLSIPIFEGSEMLYEVNGELSFDTENLQITKVGDAEISVTKVWKGSTTDEFALNQPLEVIKVESRYALYKYPNAYEGLTLRLSMAEPESGPMATVYHFIDPSQVSVSQKSACQMFRRL